MLKVGETKGKQCQVQEIEPGMYLIQKAIL